MLSWDDYNEEAPEAALEPMLARASVPEPAQPPLSEPPAVAVEAVVEAGLPTPTQAPAEPPAPRAEALDSALARQPSGEDPVRTNLAAPVQVSEVTQVKNCRYEYLSC